MASLVLIEGQIYAEEQAKIPAGDRGFLYGDMVYEILAASGGVLIDCERHLRRLRMHAERHGISVPWSDQTLRFEIEHLLAQIASPWAAVRLVVTRGIGGALGSEPKEGPRHYIYARPAERPTLEQLELGLKLKMKSHPAPRRETLSKSNAYLDTISQSLRLKEEGFDDLLWINGDGEISEAGTANIFLMAREGDSVEIATPPVEKGILAGITRGRLIDLCTAARIPVTERVIPHDELARFDEAFVTSSIGLLRPVSQIDRHRLHSTRKNAVFWHLLRLYNAWVESQIRDASASGSDPKH